MWKNKPSFFNYSTLPIINISLHIFPSLAPGRLYFKDFEINGSGFHINGTILFSYIWLISRSTTTSNFIHIIINKFFFHFYGQITVHCV